MSELTKLEEDTDWYGLLGLETGAADGAISRAFKKLSLKYHPDKNAGCKEAEKMFMGVKEAKDFLLNPTKRKNYDKKRESRLQAEALLAERNRNMGQRRRHLREELDRREKSAMGGGRATGDTVSAATAARKTKLDELRRQGEVLREQRARAKNAAWEAARMSARKRGAESAAAADEDLEERTIRVKWSRSKNSHSDDTLAKLFKIFGEVESVSLEEGKGNRALVTFTSSHATDAAMEAYGEGETMRTSYIGKKRQKRGVAARQPAPVPAHPPVGSVNSFRDRESLVMMQLRQEAERQALRRKMMEEEEMAGVGTETGPKEASTKTGTDTAEPATSVETRESCLNQGLQSQSNEETINGSCVREGEQERRGPVRRTAEEHDCRASESPVTAGNSTKGGSTECVSEAQTVRDYGGADTLFAAPVSKSGNISQSVPMVGGKGDFGVREDDILSRMLRKTVPQAEVTPVVGQKGEQVTLDEGDILARMMLHSR